MHTHFRNIYAKAIIWMAVFACIGYGAHEVFSDSAISVTATVGISGVPPTIVGVSPSSSPIVIARNTFQSFTVEASDSDSPTLAYDISVPNGVVSNPIGTVNVDAVSKKWRVNFTYYAPSSKPSPALIYITVVINDVDHTPVTRKIPIYIY